MYLKGYLTKTGNINLIKFILQNSDLLKKYLDKDDFKEINYKLQIKALNPNLISKTSIRIKK